MPNIKKAEYEALKTKIEVLEFSVDVERQINLALHKTIQELEREVVWRKRYYEALLKTFSVEETVDMPGCFNPMDTVEYIVKKQEND